MEESDTSVMRACCEGSQSGTMDFPAVVRRLSAIGCEQYHADFRRGEKTYYMPDGDTYVSPLAVPPGRIAEAFSQEQVVAALRAAQSKQITYPQFLARIVDAGCVGYFVNLAGRRAIYMGRSGDSYVEHFPQPAGQAVGALANPRVPDRH
jgi:uncharacterized protein YbcV (DUF1398 family)